MRPHATHVELGHSPTQLPLRRSKIGSANLLPRRLSPSDTNVTRSRRRTGLAETFHASSAGDMTIPGSYPVMVCIPPRDVTALGISTI